MPSTQPFLLDKYLWQARIWPAFVLLLPLVLATIAWVPDAPTVFGPVLGVIGTFGPFLLSQLMRDAGKRLEQLLFAALGGVPSSLLLRHHDLTIERPTKSRYHSKLAGLIPGIQMPDERSEERDPRGALEVYDSCSKFLVNQTRDQTKYAILFHENVSYGFRRNLVGARGLAIFIALIGLSGCATKIFVEVAEGLPPSPLTVGATVIIVLLALAWIFVFTRRWVEESAITYAVRLLHTLDTL